MKPDLGRATALSALALALAIVAPAAASAADAKTEALWRAACTRDALALCPGPALVGNRQGVQECLTRKVPRLSDSCRTVVAPATAQGDQPPAAIGPSPSPRPPRRA